MTIRIFRKWRIVSAVTAALLALPLLFAPSAALAGTPLTTYDKIPGSGHGWYYSAHGEDGPAARVRQPGGAKGWGIRWIKGKGVTVRAFLSDTTIDGRSPIFVVSYDYGDGGTHAMRELTTNGREHVSTVQRSATFAWKKGVTDWRRQSILLTVCNGRDADGNPDQCGPNHGPFHAY